MIESISEIQSRRRVTVDQAAAMLALCDTVDTGTKRSLLSTAARALPDPAIMKKWIELANAETDTVLRRQMVAQVLRYDYRQIPDLDPYVDLLFWGITQDSLRVNVLASLGALVTAHPEVVDRMSRLYAEQRTASARRAILESLCQFDTLPGAISAFFLKAIDSVDADLKLMMVQRLLRIDAIPAEKISVWLHSPEPSSLKRLLINYITDRSLPMEAALGHVLANEADESCRMAAVRALAAYGPRLPETIGVILASCQKDSSADVRTSCVACFRLSLEVTPEVQTALVGYLKTETSVPVCLMALELLMPYLSQSPATREALLALLGENLRVDVASAIYEMLGRLATWDPKLFDWLLDAYQKTTDDHLKGIILKTLSSCHEPSERLAKLYREALKAPSPALKAWGVRGLLMLPLTTANSGDVAAAADVLLDPKLNEYWKRAIARKIACIVDLTPETKATLKNVVEQADDGELKRTCQKAVDRVIEQAPASSIDFGHWYHRVEVDHNVDGIFPQVYDAYGEYPEQCRRILKVALLDPACDDSRYQNHVNDETIVRFLMTRNAIDDDICRYCLDWILNRGGNYGNHDLFLVVLRSRPSFAGFKDGIWALFAKSDISKFNSTLLRLTLNDAYGGETAAGEAFRQHFATVSNFNAASPYLEFLMNNLLWKPSRAMIKEAFGKPAILDDETKQKLQMILFDFGEIDRVEAIKPGLADD